MIAIPQSVTRRIVLKAYLTSDHVSDATGKTIAIKISKNGAAFADPSAGATNATEIANGWYYVDLSTTDTGTGGPLIIRGTCSGVDNTETYRAVVDPHNAGFDGVPAVTAGSTNGLPLAVDNSGRTDILKINGTSQTGRDIGASVLLSAGTGAGQLDFTNGVVKSNLVQILATALTETAGQIAGAFKKLFNVASPTLTCLGIDQTGDSYGRIGAAGAGLTAVGDTSGTTTLLSRIPGTVQPQTGDVYARIGSAGAGLTAIGDTRIAHLDADVSSRSTYAGGDTSGTTTLLGRIPGTVQPQTGDAYARIGAAGAGLTALGDARLAHLDADVSSRSTYAGADTPGTTTLLTEVGALPTAAAIAAAIGARAPSESYATNGAAPTYDQFLYMLWSAMTQFAVTGTAISAKKLDGSTQAMVFTTDDATNPTQRIRTT